jgi:hypothetical protein
MSTTQTVQPISGLSSAEAQKRLAKSGYNELSPPQIRLAWHIVAEVLREPMFLLMIAAGGIYLMLGDIKDALMLLFFVVLITALAVSQQHKSERVLEALRNLSSPRALVLRDGKSNDQGVRWQQVIYCFSQRLIALGSVTGLVLVLSLPALRELFHFSGDAPNILEVGVMSALSVLLLSAGMKRIVG